MTYDSPFAPVFSRPSFLETVACADALRRLEGGLGAREPFLLLTGEPGTGKTTLAHEAIARWDARVVPAFLAYPPLTAADMLEEIILRFGGQPTEGASRPKLLACLERSLAGIAGQGRVAMVVVDDAQKLSPELLEELRLLVNAAQQAGQPLEVMLIGLPALESLLEAPALAAMRQRISVRARLEPLSAGETRRYLRHRVGAAGGDGSSLFPRKTCLAIAGLTGGLPRRINALASEALRLARAAGQAAVAPDHVQAAAAVLEGAVPARAAVDRDDADSSDGEEPAAPPGPVPAAASLAPAISTAAAAPAPAAPVPPPVRAPTHAPPAEAAPAVAQAGTPSAEAVARKGAPAAEASAPAPPASHDPGEWVSRFVGDRGPVVIGAQVMGSAGPPLEPAGSGSARAPAGAGERPAPPPRARPRFGLGVGIGARAASSALLATIVVGAAAVLIIRAGSALHGRRARQAAVTTSTVAPGASSAPSAAGAGEAGSRTDADGRPATRAVTSPTGRYTLQAGEFLDYQTALDERARLQHLTGIEGWVIPAAESGGETHRVVLGVYRSRERATAAARMLVATHTLRSVNVVALPRRGARR